MGPGPLRPLNSWSLRHRMAHLCLYQTLFQGPLVAQVVSSLLLLLVLSCIFYTSLYQLLEKNNSYCTICIMCSLYTFLPHFFQITTRMTAERPKTKTAITIAVRAGWKAVFSPATGPGRFLTWPRPKKCTHINQYAVIKGFPHTLQYTYLVLCWRVRSSWTGGGGWIDE